MPLFNFFQFDISRGHRTLVWSGRAGLSFLLAVGLTPALAASAPTPHPTATATATAALSVPRPRHKPPVPAAAPQTASLPAASPATPEVPAAPASPEEARAGDHVSGLPLPRYASVHQREVNLRREATTTSPVDWVFSRRDMPVEILAEHHQWRQIRDWDGDIGWVQDRVLSSHRSMVITGNLRTLRRRPTPDAAAIAHLEPGVIGHLLHCDGAWCQVEASEYRGWLPRAEFWGVYPDERVE